MAKKFTNRELFRAYCKEANLAIIETTFGAYGLDAERVGAWLHEPMLGSIYTKDQFVPCFENRRIFEQYCAENNLSIYPNGAGFVGKREDQAIAFYGENTYKPLPEYPKASRSKKTRKPKVDDKDHGFFGILSGNTSK
jgi:hypothetical protein